ncbi:MAG: KTSC domain-containing protein [Eubacterium sp.]
MQRYPVNSSRIANIGWKSNIMEVQFHNGAIYQYYDVSKSEFDCFMQSSSLGSALSTFDKCHRYKRIL